MMDGFDLDSALVCEGIIGDGCGGGRIFFVEDETLFAYDSITEERMELLGDLKGTVSICKSACIISIKLENKTIEFNLSTLRKVSI